jgi:SAM-dependent methyltransferase
MDQAVANFYTKLPEQGYVDQYVSDHMPRVKWVCERFGLNNLHNQRVVEVGVGRGLYFSQMPTDNMFVGLDGAEIRPDQKLAPFLSLRVDLNRPDFGMLFDNEGQFDWLICSETLEHTADINNVMLQMKRLLKPNGYAVFTIPHVSVTHPVAFPGLFYPEQNFKVFIEQYAWLVEDEEVYQKGWWTYAVKVRNAPMKEQRVLFPKQEEKFWGNDPVTWTNL